MTRTLLAAGLVGLALTEWTLSWIPQSSGTGERLRGVSAVSDTVAWASGNRGAVVRTTDGGEHWAVVSPPASESLDFRDVAAIDADTAYILGIGPGDKSRIYHTTDGGRSWTLQFTNPDPKAFYDAIAFWDARSGLAVGDPVDGHFTVLRTVNGGLTWTPVPPANLPAALPGEGAFAASGTCLVVTGSQHAWFGTGGAERARVFRSADRGLTWEVADTPIAAGNASSGIFSVAFADPQHGFAVGGDYRKERDPSANLAQTTDGGRTWQTVGSTRLRGFRSAVAIVAGSKNLKVFAVGPAGSDYSADGGVTWTPIDGAGYHAFSIPPSNGTAWGVGEKGTIARLNGAWR